jgi:hypothetical protein
MENKMENKRYNFSGFTFGSNGLYNLLISVNNYTKQGTSNTIEMGIELTPEERLELIKLLINADVKEDN